MRVIAVLLFVAGFLASSLARADEQRVALVIGNARYQNSPLANPAKDAAAVARTLEAVGFNVTTLIDADQKAMKKAIRDFGAKLAGGVAVFYYAGHGMQVDGRNYLMPVDAKIEAEVDVDIEAVDVGAVLAAMEKSDSRMNVVILDACRDNPFARASRSGVRGLAFVNAPKGTLISYATAPGSVASDGEGENGPFSASLTKHMGTPGLPVEEMFKRVRNDVMHATGGKQTPWESSSLTGSFSFIGSGQPAPIVSPAPLPPERASDREPGGGGPESRPRSLPDAQTDTTTAGGDSRAPAQRTRFFVGASIGQVNAVNKGAESAGGPHKVEALYPTLGGGVRVELAQAWQAEVRASFGLASATEGYTPPDSGPETSYQGTLTFWNLAVEPTVRAVPGGVWYFGLGVPVRYTWWTLACDPQVCESVTPTVSAPSAGFSFGGSAQTGILLGADQDLDIGALGSYSFGTTIVMEGGLAVRWAFR